MLQNYFHKDSMPAATPLLRQLHEDAEKLSRNQRVLARFILANYQNVAFWTVTELAAQSGVSEATIVRFAQRLNFAGYPALQKEIRRMLRADLQGMERFQLGAAQATPGSAPLDPITRKERENLSALYDAFDPKGFGRAVKALRTASEVVVVGTRSTASLAYHLSFALGKLAIKTTRVTSISSETFDLLTRLDRRACVLVIGFPRYLRELVAVLTFSRQRKLRTVSITDSAFSPLKGDVTIYAPAESASFVAFHCAPLVLINALVHALGIADSNRTMVALEQFETVAQAQGYFAKE
jgi:DNA-binding MurR/RpiR family transcriptional regulator